MKFIKFCFAHFHAKKLTNKEKERSKYKCHFVVDSDLPNE